MPLKKKIDSYFEVDLDEFQACFKPVTNDLNFPVVTFCVLEQAKMYGVLENKENFKQLTFITMIVTRFTTLLNLNHSVAINVGRLPLAVVCNYSYGDLIKQEINCLFEAASVFGKVIQYLYEDGHIKKDVVAERTLHMVLKLVDKLHMKILHLSASLN